MLWGFFSHISWKVVVVQIKFIFSFLARDMPIPVSVSALNAFGFLLQSSSHIFTAQPPYALCVSLLSLICSTCIQSSPKTGWCLNLSALKFMFKDFKNPQENWHHQLKE